MTNLDSLTYALIILGLILCYLVWCCVWGWILAKLPSKTDSVKDCRGYPVEDEADYPQVFRRNR